MQETEVLLTEKAPSPEQAITLNAGSQCVNAHRRLLEKIYVHHWNRH